LIPGTPLAQVYGSGSLADKKLHRAMNMGIERSMFQDFAFGLRQLADISARALSPAVNDPTTAVNAFDRIHALLGHIVTLPLGGRSHSDRKGVLRLIEPMPTWQDLVDLAYTETRQYGAGSPQVTRRLAASLEDLLLIAPEDRKAPLLEQRALLQADVGRAHADAREREFALTPDRQGIG
jgi:uncharacterized membrane protein